MGADRVGLGRPDVWALRPEAQRIVLHAANIYLEYTRPWMIGLLAHGSALKGDYIPGCSDIDLQLYLRDEAFDHDGRLPFEVSVWIQRSLATIELGSFAYIQCYALPQGPREGWSGPVPGAYHMILGSLPRPEATADVLRETAERALAALRPVPDYIAEGMLTYSPARLERHARLLCTDVWPFIHHILTLTSHDPIAAWRFTKTEAIERLPSGDVRDTAQRFYDTAWSAFAANESRLGDTQLQAQGFTDLIRVGVEFRTAASRWYRERSDM